MTCGRRVGRRKGSEAAESAVSTGTGRLESVRSCGTPGGESFEGEGQHLLFDLFWLLLNAVIFGSSTSVSYHCFLLLGIGGDRQLRESTGKRGMRCADKADLWENFLLPTNV